MSDYDWLTRDEEVIAWLRARPDTKGLKARFEQGDDGKWEAAVSMSFAEVSIEGASSREDAENALLAKLRIVMHEMEGQ